jgi:S-adenosylmethionine hydrolase
MQSLIAKYILTGVSQMIIVKNSTTDAEKAYNSCTEIHNEFHVSMPRITKAINNATSLKLGDDDCILTRVDNENKKTRVKKTYAELRKIELVKMNNRFDALKQMIADNTTEMQSLEIKINDEKAKIKIDADELLKLSA